jgi:non-reducing end alpha-L-arabinofuranosidase
VTAHSTTRALFASFSGALYQVQRSSDSTTIGQGEEFDLLND